MLSLPAEAIFSSTSNSRSRISVGLVSSSSAVLAWAEIDRELADLHAGKVLARSNPATREAELLDEQDSLEFELGEDYFRNPWR
jgi:hypothetical protein